MTTTQKIIKYCAIAFALTLVISIVGGIVSAITGIVPAFGSGSAEGKMKEYTIAGTVKDLSIDIDSAQLELRTGDSFTAASNLKYLTLENKDGVLSIWEDRPAVGMQSGNARLVLTIPKEYEFDTAIILTGAGTVKIEELLTDDLDLNLGAGEVEIDRIAADHSARIDGGAGELTIDNGRFADLDFDMGVGEVNMVSSLKGKSKIDYGVGELNLTLVGEPEDYTISLDKGLGSAIIDGKEMGDGAVYGDGENSVEIDGGIGELNVRWTRE